MTQQNETEQQPAGPEQSAPAPGALQPTPQQSSQSAPTLAAPQPAPTSAASQPAQSGPMYPSPYLDGGEAVPQAYLAPPQPGQPRYGSPPGPQGGRPAGGSQPRYGQPPAGRPARGGAAAAHRDPAVAPASYRFAAATIDWFIIFVASLIPFWSGLSRIEREMETFATHHQRLSSPAAQAAFNSIVRAPANERTVLYWLVGMFGIALVYYWVQYAAWGATVGKRALGVRVVGVTDRSRIGVRQAGIRTVAFLVGPALFVMSQAEVDAGGRAVSTGLVTALYALGAVLWAADGVLVLLDSRAQSLHDKLAGTIVVRQRWLDQRSRGSQSW
jgi:uncharacterized RDD family membrane protein YckC